jgi:hypothetical protein
MTDNLAVEGRPEAKLRRLNAAMLRLIGDLMVSEQTYRREVSALREVLRSTTLTEALSDRLLFAVAGPQGAGKTTLVRELYDLDGTWLKPNLGRGERIPILIVEDDRDEPQGVVWELQHDTVTAEAEFVERETDPLEWQSVVRSAGSNVMLVELRVPASCFGVPGTGFLLLPGYEIWDDSDEAIDWQALMRRALIASPGAIVVTDEQLLATSQQQLIVDDLTTLYGGKIKPVICVARTENLRNDEARETLERRAAEVFGVETDAVVLTGTGPAYRDEWRDALLEALGHVQEPSRIRPLQLAQLVTVLDTDLREVLSGLSLSVQVDGLLNDDQAYRDWLDLFDQSAKFARDEYAKEVERNLLSQFSQAVTDLRKYTDEHGGWSGAKDKIVDWLQIRTAQRNREHQDRLVSMWNKAATSPRGVVTNHSDMVRVVQWEVARSALVSVPEARPEEPVAELAASSTSPSDASVNPNLGVESMNLPDFILSDARFFSGAMDPDAPGKLLEPSLHFDQTVRMLPAMGLEVLRFSLENTSAVVGRSGVKLHHTDEQGLVDAVSKIAETRRTLLRAGVAVIGLDLLANGTIDTIPTLASAFQTLFFGAAPAAGATGTAAAAATASTLATAAGAAFMSAAVAAAVLQYANAAQGRAYARSEAMLAGAKESAEQDLLNQFDDLMGQVRRRVDVRLRGYLNVGAAAVRQLHLRKAIGDVNEAMVEVLRDATIQRSLV